MNCSCDFPVHGYVPPKPPAKRPARAKREPAAADADRSPAQAPGRKPAAKRRHSPVPALPEPVPAPPPPVFQGPTVYVPMIPSPPTVYAPPRPPAPSWPADPEVVVVERDRRVRRYKRMQPALVWLVQDLAERAGLDGEVWGDMTDRLLLDNGWSREAVGLLARALTEELARVRPARLTVDVDVELERIVVGALVSDGDPVGLRL